MIVSEKYQTIMQRGNMKIVTIKMDLVIDDDVCELVNGVYSKDCVVDYLNSKLYEDPEFFGDFGQENVIDIKEFV